MSVVNCIVAGVRVLELDFLRTSLPNNAANSQNDLRIAFGLSYRH